MSDRLFIRIGDHVLNVDRITEVNLKPWNTPTGENHVTVYHDGKWLDFTDADADALRAFFVPGRLSFEMDQGQVIDLTPVNGLTTEATS